MKRTFIACASLALFSLAANAQLGGLVPEGAPKDRPSSTGKSLVSGGAAGGDSAVYGKSDTRPKQLDPRDLRNAAPELPPGAALVVSQPNPRKLRVERSDAGLNTLAEVGTPASQSIVRPAGSLKDAAVDRVMPESGTRVTERVVHKQVVERMVPPSDDLIYGALKAQGLSEANSDAQSQSGSASSKPIVINAIQGVNEIITIGKGDLNRFVTPFGKVVVRTAAGEDELVSKVDGNIAYIGATKRSGVFLTEAGSDRAISLTLVPDDVPPRDIYLRLGKSPSIPAAMQKAVNEGSPGAVGPSPTGKALPHVEALKAGMRELALGRIPSGFTLLKPKATDAKCLVPGFRMRLGQVLEGSGSKYMVYRAENMSPTTEASIDEQYCYKKGVIAISAWPDVTVAPGGATEVFVLISMKAEEEEEEVGTRPSLIAKD